jgi:hypothetical protein
MISFPLQTPEAGDQRKTFSQLADQRLTEPTEREEKLPHTIAGNPRSGSPVKGAALDIQIT